MLLERTSMSLVADKKCNCLVGGGGHEESTHYRAAQSVEHQELTLAGAAGLVPVSAGLLSVW